MLFDPFTELERISSTFFSEFPARAERRSGEPLPE